MFNRSINLGSGVNNRSGDTLQAICTLINDLVVEHNNASAHSVNVFRYIPPGEWPSIQNRTSTYDCHAAVIAATNSQTSGTSSSAIGSFVSFPAGQYRFAQTLNLKRGIGFIGLGSGLAGGAQVEFIFDAGVTGVIVNRHDTDGFGAASSTTGADASLFVGLTLTGAGYSSSTPEAHGLVMRARAKCVSVICREFKGDGFRIHATAVGATDEQRGNANLFHLENCTGNRNWGSGLSVDGADVNAGNVIAFNGVNNGRWGVLDSSFLGNTYLGCHVATNSQRGQVFHINGRYYLIDDALGGITEPGTNPAVWVYLNDSGVHSTYPQWVNGNSYITGGAYKSESNSAVNCFLGCYSEGGQAPSNIAHPAIVLGGLHGAGFSAASSAFRIEGRRLSSFEVPAASLSSNEFLVQFSFRADEAIALSAQGDHSNGLALCSWDAAAGDWMTRHARASSRTPVRYTTDLSTFTGGRSAAVGGGHVRFPRGAFFGQRMIDSGIAPPTSGESAMGDMRINENAAIGLPSYWQCTTAGVNGAGAVWTPGPTL